MIGKPEEMRALTTDLAMSVWTLAAIGVLFESGLADQLREPHSIAELAARCPSLSEGRIARCLAVAGAAGVVVADGERHRLAPGAMPFAQPPMRASIEGDVRSHLMQPIAFLDAARAAAPTNGWRHTDAALLKAQGDASSMFPPMFKMHFVPALGDLGARLERPGARFLDVGVGVASLSVAMCRAWPQLQVVGVDTFEAPLALARENVTAAGLADRIELRRIGAQDILERDAFDLAWLPSIFIAPSAIESVVARVHASLSPGGWLLFPVGGIVTGDERYRSVYALLSELWGGPALTPSEGQRMLEAAGFSTVRVMPGPPWSPPFLAARRGESP